MTYTRPAPGAVARPSGTRRRPGLARLAAVVGALLLPAAARAAADGAFGLGAGTETYAGGPIDNVFTTLAANAGAGSSTIVVASAGGLGIGDIVMLWQPAGGSVDSGGTTTLVAGTSIGQWELARIEAVAGTTLTIETDTKGAALQHSYPATVTEVVRVPQYGPMTITGTVSAQPWDPATHTGGIIAFLSNGTVTVNGTLSADGAGGRGGVPTLISYDPASSLTCDSKDVTDATTGQGQTRGEGVAGSRDKTNGADQGFGNVANGGGAGNCQQNGGGGGGNAGAGGGGGKGSVVGKQFPGNGGAAIDYGSVSMSRQIVFGGGGGAGNQSFGTASAGRDGGGVIWFRALALAGGGTISASGSSAGTSGANDGEGGGGAGGSIYIRVAGSATLCGTGFVHADGSAGLSMGAMPTPSPDGAGGGGGGGRIFIQDSSGTCVLGAHVTVAGGAAGVEPSGGPAAGRAGSIETAPSSQYCSTDGNLSTPPCPPSRPVCEPTNNWCVECLSSADCPSSAPVCNGADTCEGCTSDTDCSGRPSAPRCANPGAATGRCVQCLSNADCSGTTPFCNAGVCVACNFGSPPQQTADLRCTDADAPICQGDGSCGPCTAAAQCQTRSAATPLCASGACAPCATNAACDAAYPSLPVCASGACIACAAHADCDVDPLRPACSGTGGCVPCDQVAGGEADVCGPLGKHCESNAASSLHGSCVGCRSMTTPVSLDCAGSLTTPACDPTTDTCVACDTSGSWNAGAAAGEAACAGNHAAAPHCATAGTSEGSCVQCRDDGDCGAATPLCDLASNLCVAAPDMAMSAPDMATSAPDMAAPGDLSLPADLAAPDLATSVSGGGGCACDIDGRAGAPSWGVLLLLALALFRPRRRRASSIRARYSRQRFSSP